MNEGLNILIVEDCFPDSQLVERQLQRGEGEHTLSRVSNRAEFLSEIDAFLPDLVLSESHLPDFEGAAVLQLLREHSQEVPLIFVCNEMSESDAVELFRQGATDYVLKHDISRLKPAIQKALLGIRTESERRQSEEKYRNVFEKAVIGIFQCLNNCYLSVNPHFARLHGYGSPEEMLAAISDIPSQVPVRRSEYLRSLQLLKEKGNLENFEIEHYCKDGQTIWLNLDVRTVLDQKGQLLFYEGFAQNISERKKNGAELEAVQDRLIKASRYAGMAEVATSVLHNVSNVLNSVHVSTSQIMERFGNFPHGQVGEVAGLLRANDHDLSQFVSRDGRGAKLIVYLEQLAGTLRQEHSRILQEMVSLVNNIEHIDAVITTQQRYATMAGLIETVDIAEIVEDALRMNAAGLLRHGVEIIRDYSPLLPLFIDRHRVMQILINLINNAKYALSGIAVERRITLRTQRSRADFASITIADNGIGISAANMTRIFEHGFTTHRTGHGFGLHSSTLAAQELGGTLTASSDGPGCGAEFILEIPYCEATSDFAMP